MSAAVVPLVEELVPCPDPWDVARKLAHLPHLLFLDSADRHPDRGRYSYVTADPQSWIIFGNEPPPSAPNDDEVVCGPWPMPRGDSFTYLADRIASLRTRTVSDLPPFQGGFAGLFCYGLARCIEDIAEPRADEFRVPHLTLGGYRWVVSFDHSKGRAWLISHPSADRERLAGVRAILAGTVVPATHHRMPCGEDGLLTAEQLAPQHPLPDVPGVTSNFSPDGYRAAVRRAVEYVHAGDCFQVNLSQRLLAPLAEHPLELYGRLRRTSPAPFGCYFDLGDFQILSASPERFLQVHPDGEIVTRPIKGTRPRGRTPAEDAELIRDLVTNPKDRAENVMIVDLLRNDIGRVAEFGSVRVQRVCELETFSHVHHLVSEVRGKLRAGLTPFDLLRAAFPGGSVTGAPKVRAMEIIAELEPTARGPYCGSVGFVGFDGATETNILIRTFTAGRGWVQFPVGGGIVADSDPAAEYAETLHKAAGLLRALQR
jgi:para-aminobenzoate synthetase component 1